MKPVSAPWLTQDCTRRRFLQAVALGLAGAGLVGCGSDTPDTGRVAAGPPGWLAQPGADQAAAARLGRIYLETHPAEGDRNTLVGLIEEAMTPQTGDGADPAAMAAALQEAVREDYARDVVVPVDGWLLSVTEARLYALLAVLQAGA